MGISHTTPRATYLVNFRARGEKFLQYGNTKILYFFSAFIFDENNNNAVEGGVTITAPEPWFWGPGFWGRYRLVPRE